MHGKISLSDSDVKPLVLFPIQSYLIEVLNNNNKKEQFSLSSKLMQKSSSRKGEREMNKASVLSGKRFKALGVDRNPLKYGSV